MKKTSEFFRIQKTSVNNHELHLEKKPQEHICDTSHFKQHWFLEYSRKSWLWHEPLRMEWAHWLSRVVNWEIVFKSICQNDLGLAVIDSKPFSLKAKESKLQTWSLDHHLKSPVHRKVLYVLTSRNGWVGGKAGIFCKDQKEATSQHIF